MGFKQLGLVFIFTLMGFNGYTATMSDPCGDASLLDLTDRGSISNTPCVLPSKSLMIEAGYQYKRFAWDIAQQNYPQPTLFLGLPEKTELAVTTPTYKQHSTVPLSGLSASTAGLKHEFTYGKDWVISGEVLLTSPGGSAAFGSQGVGMIVNGLFGFTISPKVSMIMMIGGSTATLSSLLGGERFNSFNPSLAITYEPIEKLGLFVETFMHTQTGPDLGGNYNVDCGFLYLLTPNVVLDFEVGQQLGHEVASFNQFIGGGVTVKF